MQRAWKTARLEIRKIPSVNDIEEEGDIEVYNNQYRGTYIDYMTDEDEDDQDEKAEGKYYYMKSDRTTNVSDHLTYEETNSYINQYNLQLPLQLFT